MQHDKRGGAHAATTRGTHLKGTARFSAERANPFSDPLIATIGVTALALYLWTVPAIYRANRYLIVEAGVESRCPDWAVILAANDG